MKWVTTESCSYSPQTYCSYLFLRNIYHPIFMICNIWSLSYKPHTAGTVKAWPTLLLCHKSRLDEHGVYRRLKMGAGRKKKLLFELENDKEILDDNSVERVLLTSMLNSSPTSYDRTGTEMQAAACASPLQHCRRHLALTWFVSMCIKDIPDLRQEN